MTRATRVIRRKESFNKMDQLVCHVEGWLYTSAGLEKTIDEQVAAAAEAFHPTPAGEEEKDGARGWWLFSDKSIEEKEKVLGVGLHKITIYHKTYEEAIEVELLKYLEVLGVTVREFQEVCALSEVEEERDGAHFYRWHEASSFAVFHEAAVRYHCDKTVSPAETVRKAIETKSKTARVNHRRRKRILPLIDKWDLRDFSDLISVLENPECPKPALPIKAKKELARWRLRITKKQQTATGIYVPPEADRGEWAAYVAHLTRYFEDEADFADFYDYLAEHVAKLPITTPEGKTRRLAWEAFNALDEPCARFLPFTTVVRHLESLSPLSKSEKKVLAHYSADCADHTSPAAEPRLPLHVFRSLVCGIAGNRGVKAEELFMCLKTKAMEHRVA